MGSLAFLLKKSLQKNIMLTNSKLTWWNSKWIAAQDLGTRFSPRWLSLRLKACRISFHRWSPQAFVVGIVNWIHLSTIHTEVPNLCNFIGFNIFGDRELIWVIWLCLLQSPPTTVLDRVSVKLLCAQLTSPNSINQVSLFLSCINYYVSLATSEIYML